MDGVADPLCRVRWCPYGRASNTRSAYPTATEEARSICLLDCTRTDRDAQRRLPCRRGGHLHPERQAHDLGRLTKRGFTDETFLCFLQAQPAVRRCPAGGGAGRALACWRPGCSVRPHKLTMTPDLFENPFPDIASNEGGSLPGVEPDELPDQWSAGFPSAGQAVRSGAYEVTVQYFSCQTPDAPTFNMLSTPPVPLSFSSAMVPRRSAPTPCGWMTATAP